MLTAREREVLGSLSVYRTPVRPMDIGGKDASHHSATLAKLARRGLVKRSRRAGYVRPSWLYSLTAAGRRAAEARP